MKEWGDDRQGGRSRTGRAQLERRVVRTCVCADDTRVHTIKSFTSHSRIGQGSPSAKFFSSARLQLPSEKLNTRKNTGSAALERLTWTGHLRHGQSSWSYKASIS